MLSQLIIKNFVLIEETCLSFKTQKVGLHILTGEAGAGKSIILQALQGVFGHKLIAKNTQNLALDDTKPIHLKALCYSNSVIHAWLLEQELPLIHRLQHQLVLERIITKNFITHKNKNKYLINGISVTSEQSQYLGSLLMMFQGQHAQQVLLDCLQHTALFDECMQLNALKNEVTQKAANVIECLKRIQFFEQLQEQHAQEKERILWEQTLISEITTPLSIPFSAELWENLNNQQKQLQAQLKLQQTLQYNHQKIQNIQNIQNIQSTQITDHSTRHNNTISIAQKIQSIHDDLKNVQKEYLWLDPILQHLEEISIHLEEVDYLFSHQLQQLHFDDDELQSVEQTLQKIWGAARKLKITPQSLHEYFLENQQRLVQLQKEQSLIHIQKELQQLQQEYHEKAEVLSHSRLTQAAKLESMMQQLLYDLGLESALFKVVFIDTSKEVSMHGYERIQFYFDAQGNYLQPLQNVASGGELSRIHLALCLCQNLNSAVNDVNPLLVFDEIDAGLSGEMAQRVGKLLKKLGEHRQILCVTHLPQVAGYADASIQIQKRNDASGEIRSFLNILETEEEKVSALANLLGGDKTTATSHAQNLFKE